MHTGISVYNALCIANSYVVYCVKCRTLEKQYILAMNSKKKKARTKGARIVDYYHKFD